MLKFIGNVFERIVLIVVVLLALQAPLFMQNYAQQLRGRLAELQTQVSAINMIAGERGKSAYIAKFLASKDPDFVAQGAFLDGILQRHEDLNAAFIAFDEAALWQKPVQFLIHLKWDVAVSTYHQYEIGLPLNVEGAIYALFGLLFGMGLIHLVKGLFNLRFKNKSVNQSRPC